MAVASELSPEVQWYLDSRGYVLPENHAIPLWRTEEPGENGELFDADRVDKVIQSLRVLKHTKGRWAGQALEPTPVQVAYFIAPIFGWVHENSEGVMVRVIQEAYIEMPRKSAKALALGTELLTPNGWVKIDDIKAGDSVPAPDGTWALVTDTSEVFEDRELYRVTTSDGRTLDADAEHLWTIRDRARRRLSETLTTADLLTRGTTYGSRGTNRFVLPRQHAIQIGDHASWEPYLVGYWLGDGFSSGARLAVGDEDLYHITKMIRTGYRVQEASGCWRVSVPALLPKLKKFNLIGNKHIPDEYMMSSIDSRLELLRGLMDSDGTIGTDGKNKVSFTSTNKTLVTQVRDLVRSLGWKAGIDTGPAKIDGRTVGSYWRCSWVVCSSDPNPFKISRKANRVSMHKADDRRFTVTIKSIEPIGRGDSRCIKIDREDGLFLAGKDLVVTHNTTLASGFGMYLAFADGEAGAEVVFGAASKDQAGAAFRPVESLARASKVLQRAGIVATKTHITQAATTSTLKVVSSRGDLAHGANIHGALIDELHVHKNPDLLEAIESGTGAREQPLTIIITTADDGQVVGTYAQRRDMVEKVCNGILKQSATYAIIFAASDTDDPFTESTWRKSNPLYPVTPSPEFMRKAADKAKSNPVAMASFLRLHLGIRAKQGSRYISLEHWKKAGLTTFKEGSLQGRLAYGGLDLSSVSDLTALAWLFPDDMGGYDALYRFWLPEAALEALDGATARMASAWVADGWITLTPGDVVDYDWIKSTIVEDSLKFRVAEIGYDRWNSSQMVIDLQDKEGMPMTKVGQGAQSMSPALKELDRLVRLGRFHAGDNPVMLWMIDNLRVASDAAGNIKPDKSKSLAKIDGVSATLDALFCAMNSDYVQEAESAYETGSLTVV